MSDKIDFVITWVNGNDPAWRIERDHYAALEQKEVDNSRYRDWETLRYWFRGVENFAPWVNKVFFVTWGHLPEWLDINHPKLKIVKHSDFIPAEYLPTFSSNVFEFYFHKIEGLSDKFVYFNDDTFLIDTVKSTRFFKKDLPCDLGGMSVNIHNGMFGSSVLLAKTLINDYFKKQEVVFSYPSKWFNLMYIRQSILNLMCLLVRKEEFLGFVNPHLPQGYLKKTYDDVWAHCSSDIIRTSRCKFRNYGDIAPWLIRYWQLVSNNFSPCNVYRDGIYYLLCDSIVPEVVKCISRQKKKIICLNDSEELTNFEDTKNSIVDAFERIFPNKCSFER